jgi:hypothetical protein
MDVLSLGRGVRLGLVVEGEGQVPGTCVCDDLSTTIHPLQYRGFELDMQETSATDVCVLVQYLSLGKGVRLRIVVEGGGRVPGSCVTRPSLPDRLERARPC